MYKIPDIYYILWKNEIKILKCNIFYDFCEKITLKRKHNE